MIYSDDIKMLSRAIVLGSCIICLGLVLNTPDYTATSSTPYLINTKTGEVKLPGQTFDVIENEVKSAEWLEFAEWKKRNKKSSELLEVEILSDDHGF